MCVDIFSCLLPFLKRIPALIIMMYDNFELFRVLKAVDFHRKFDELPQYIPNCFSESGTPLPLSPLEIVNIIRKRKQSIGTSEKIAKCNYILTIVETYY